jgi:uncharacterized membrane protein YcgQ (UPF0703/DUF1980 family)
MTKNKIIFFGVILLLGIVFLVTLLYTNSGKSNARVLPPGTHGVVITEIIQTSNYTYLQVEENKNNFWIAVVKANVKKGDSVYYSQAYEMKNFVSKELSRTFPAIFFVQDPSNKLFAEETPAPQSATPQKAEIKQWSEVSVEVPKGGITIAELYKNPGNFAGKTVTIRGVVVRFNSQIMNKNWIHIQDGTDFSGKFDLTITTMDSVAVGTKATFTGIMALNKDFGAGYAYDVIMEQAKATDLGK